MKRKIVTLFLAIAMALGIASIAACRFGGGTFGEESSSKKTSSSSKQSSSYDPWEEESYDPWEESSSSYPDYSSERESSSVSSESHTHVYDILNYHATHHWMECACGAEAQKILHDYTEAKMDADYHWRECKCGAINTKSPHNYALSDTDADYHWMTCPCGVDAVRVAHTYSIIKKDATQHWGVCECGVATEKVAHSYTIVQKDATQHWKECTCGAAGIKTAHSYTIANKDATYHWTECECGAVSQKEAHNYATAHKDGEYHWTECACGAVTTKVAHSYTIVQKDENEHWKECTCGEVRDKADHEYSEKLIVESGKTLCVDGGKNYNVCDVCAYMQSEPTSTVAPTGHHSGAWSKYVTPTATSEGSLSGTCDTCGYYVHFTLPALKRANVIKAGEDKVGYLYNPIRDNCNEVGTGEYTIIVDGQEFVYEIVIYPSFHVLEGEEIDDSLIFKLSEYKGLTLVGNIQYVCQAEKPEAYFICEDCKKLIVVQVEVEHVPPQNLSQISVVQPTCTVAGSRSYVCTACNKSYTEEIPATGHEYTYTIVYNKSSKTYTLTGTCVKGDDVKTETVSESRITYVDTLAPTCQTTGTRVYTYEKQDETITVTAELPEAAHTLNGVATPDEDENGNPIVYVLGNGIESIGANPPGCGADDQTGQGYFICEDCGKVIVVTVKGAHTKPSPDQITVVEPTYDKEGSESYECTECHEHVVEILPPKKKANE